MDKTNKYTYMCEVLFHIKKNLSTYKLKKIKIKI